MSHLLLQGDARRPLLAADSVDLILTDPPYGTRVDRDGYGRRRLWKGNRHVAGDGSLDTMRLGMYQAYRCLRPHSWAMVFCSPKRHRQSIEACESARPQSDGPLPLFDR
jgi:tRNA G10  N-methylase Trm11